MPKEECQTIRNSYRDKEAQYPILVFWVVMNYSFLSLIQVIKLLPVAAFYWWRFWGIKMIRKDMSHASITLCREEKNIVGSWSKRRPWLCNDPEIFPSLGRTSGFPHICERGLTTISKNDKRDVMRSWDDWGTSRLQTLGVQKWVQRECTST